MNRFLKVFCFAVFAFSSTMLTAAEAKAGVLGQWSGSGYVYDNVAHGFECPILHMKFQVKKDKLTFEQAGDCVDFSLSLSGSLKIKGNELFDLGTKVGRIEEGLIEFEGYELGDMNHYNLKAAVKADGTLDFVDSIHYFGGRIDTLEATLKATQK